MAISYNRIKQLAHEEQFIERIEKRWDAEIERDATENGMTRFWFAFTKINNEAPSARVVAQLKARYESAGWRVDVIEPDLDAGYPSGGIKLGPPD